MEIENSNYIFLNGECCSRRISQSKWKQISIMEGVYSGNNEEILSIPLMGWTCEQPHTKENGEIIAVIWQDLSKKNTTDIQYKDKDAENDNYALSCIIEVLREFLSDTQILQLLI